jgi:hypothetical protein
MNKVTMPVSKLEDQNIRYHECSIEREEVLKQNKHSPTFQILSQSGSTRWR